MERAAEVERAAKGERAVEVERAAEGKRAVEGRGLLIPDPKHVVEIHLINVYMFR